MQYQEWVADQNGLHAQRANALCVINMYHNLNEYMMTSDDRKQIMTDK